jgi:CHAT domain-containing protein
MIRFILFLIIGGPIYAQTNPLADSLRIMQVYGEEFDLRAKEKDPTARLLAKANQLILEEKDKEASAILDKIISSKEKFWYQVTKSRLLTLRGEYDQALEILQKLNPKKGSAEAAIKELEMAKNMEHKQEYVELVKHYEKSLEHLKKTSYTYLLGTVLNDLAFAYDEAGFRHKTIQFSDQALKIFMEHYPKDYSIVSVCFNNLLFYVIEYGDKKKSSEVHEKYVQYMEHFLANKKSFSAPKKFEDLHAEGLYRLSDLRYTCFKNGDILGALNRLETFHKRAPKAWSQENVGIVNSGIEAAQYQFRQQKRFDLALKYTHQIGKYQKTSYTEMKKNAAFALTYYDAKDYEKSLPYTLKCLEEFDFPKGSKSWQTLMALKAHLESKLKMDPLSTLKTLFDATLKEDIKEFNPDKYPQHINKIFIQVLIRAAWISNELNKPQDATFYFRLAAKIFEKYYQNGYYNDSLGEILDDLEDGLYQEKGSEKEIIENLNQLERITNAHLWSRFSSKYLQNLNLPKEELQRKNQLELRRNQLSRTYELELANHREIKEIDLQLDGIQNRLSAVSKEFAILSATNFDVKEVQKLLKPKEVLVKYTTGSKNIYAHIITQNSIQLKPLGEIETVKKHTQTFINELKKIKHLSSQIYQPLRESLIHPLDLEKYESIVFISEDFLSYVPFELLFKSMKPVSHAFSFKNLLLTRMNSTPLSISGNLAGFVPTYPNSQRDLKFTRQELSNIEVYIGSTSLFEGPKASKQSFLGSVGKYRIHHLAMHSEMDDEDFEMSSLSFYAEEKLHFHEIYSLNFPSEMVVLSACNTGSGQYLNGEGVMSLARALSYAGVRSSLTSLWQVPDKESAELMVLFYKYLSKGLEKDLALIKAKEEFIENHPMHSHPYFWAGFILTGDTRPLKEKKNYTYLLLGLGLIAAVLAYRKLR